MLKKNLPDTSSDEDEDVQTRSKRPPKLQRAKRKDELSLLSPMSSARSSDSEPPTVPAVKPAATIDESPPKLDVEGNVVQDKKKTDTLRRLFSVGGKGGKGGKGGGKGGKGKGVPGIVVECEDKSSAATPPKIETKEVASFPILEKKKQQRKRSAELAERPRIVCRIPLSRINYPFKKPSSEEIRTKTEMANTRQDAFKCFSESDGKFAKRKDRDKGGRKRTASSDDDSSVSNCDKDVKKPNSDVKKKRTPEGLGAKTDNGKQSKHKRAVGTFSSRSPSPVRRPCSPPAKVRHYTGP